MSASADLHDVWESHLPLGISCNHCLHRALIPRERIGHIICNCLIPRDGQTVPDQEIVIDPEFILRDSTGPAPSR